MEARGEGRGRFLAGAAKPQGRKEDLSQRRGGAEGTVVVRGPFLPWRLGELCERIFFTLFCALARGLFHYQ